LPSNLKEAIDWTVRNHFLKPGAAIGGCLDTIGAATGGADPSPRSGVGNSQVGPTVRGRVLIQRLCQEPGGVAAIRIDNRLRIRCIWRSCPAGTNPDQRPPARPFFPRSRINGPGALKRMPRERAARSVFWWSSPCSPRAAGVRRRRRPGPAKPDFCSTPWPVRSVFLRGWRCVHLRPFAGLMSRAARPFISPLLRFARPPPPRGPLYVAHIGQSPRRPKLRPRTRLPAVFNRLRRLSLPIATRMRAARRRCPRRCPHTCPGRLTRSVTVAALRPGTTRSGVVMKGKRVILS